MKEPRPAMISARPPEIRSSVENCWNTRTGSSEDSTLTALVSLMRLVRSAAAASATAGADASIVRAVMLAKPEDVEPDLVGKLDLLDKVAHALIGQMARVFGSGSRSAKV